MDQVIPNKLHHEIIPGILEKEWEEIEKKIEIVKPFVKTIHIDLLDGKFASNSTWMDPKPFKKYADSLFLELHMMVENPLKYLKPFADCGFKRFIGHVEKMPDIEEFVAEGQLLGEVGLAFDKPTSLEKLQNSYEDIDVILIMTIQAGFSAQQFLPELLEKATQIRQASKFIPIEVDGGISDTTITQAKEAGATRFVANSFLFNSPNAEEKYSSLRRMIG